MASEKEMKVRVGVVLPAAGCGERMNLSIPKQFYEVNGRPLIAYTIDCFHKIPWIEHIVIATCMDHVDMVKDIATSFGFGKVSVVHGGVTRHRSIHLGLKSLQHICSGLDVVIIHDAVRPFVSNDIIQKVAETAHLHGAAGVSRPLISTVIARNDDQELLESLDRARYVASEMPQAFQTSVISAAYDKCTQEDFDHGTECLLLAMKNVGVHAVILDGGPDLWKVTYKKDLFAAEFVLKEKLLRIVLKGCTKHPDLAGSIREELEGHHLKILEDQSPSEAFSDMGPPSEGADGANTVIIVHSDVTIMDTVNKVYAMQSQFLPSWRSPGVIDFTFVHVFLVPEEENILECQPAISRVLSKMAANLLKNGILIFGVLASENQVAARVGRMVSSVVWRGASDFSEEPSFVTDQPSYLWKYVSVM